MKICGLNPHVKNYNLLVGLVKCNALKVFLRGLTGFSPIQSYSKIHPQSLIERPKTNIISIIIIIIIIILVD